MNCIQFLRKIGVLHPFVSDDEVVAAKQQVIRENTEAAEQSSTATREMRSAAIVATAALNLLQGKESGK